MLDIINRQGITYENYNEILTPIRMALKVTI